METGKDYILSNLIHGLKLLMLRLQLSVTTTYRAGFLARGGGGQNEVVWIIGGASTYISVCKACGKLGESGGMLPGKF